jgi:beta-glucosidase
MKTKESTVIYREPSAPVDLRVRDLLKRMTLEEKVAQLGSVWLGISGDKELSEERAQELLGKGIGQMTRISGAREINPGEGAKLANSIQRYLVERTRLGIPAIVHEECLSGFMARGGTVFPQAIGLASTWDPELVQEVTTVIRRQMRASGAHQGLAPVLDVARDPRWGRTEETFGEDPYLVARMGVAYVKGLQGEDLRFGVIATPKHFAAHGFPEGGRNCAPVHVSQRELREVFLFPFEAAIKLGGAMSLMNAYHEIDGIPCAASRELLTTTLRGEWDFEGFVVSDYGAIRMLETFHMVASDAKDAATQALEAGIDIELPTVDCYGKSLIEAVEDGMVSQATVDRAVYRVLKAKFILGLFENPYVDAEAAAKNFDTPADRELALRAARESIVLLKNDGVLPLGEYVRSIAVIGPNADSTRNLHGDYSFTSHIPSVEQFLGRPKGIEEDAVPTVSILRGIRSKVPPNVNVGYARGCDVSSASRDGFPEALEVARGSDVVIAVMGEKSGLSESDISGEGRDRTSLGLPGVQEDLVRELSKLGKPIVLVLVNGRPISLGWMADACSAVLEAWYPGEEGGSAVADVILGRYNPGGKLPISFPAEVGQVPLNYSRKPSSFRDYISTPSRPLFPFGHGLSYTKFEYDNLVICPDKLGPNGRVKIRLRVRNVGGREGDEVVQLYTRDVVASVSRPVKELKGFKRINLKPGEAKEVEFILHAEQLAFYDRNMRLVVEPGSYEVMVGSSSEDIRLKGSFEITGETKLINSRSVFFSEVNVQ